ncbi:MAG TPA: signal peptidase I [Polyangiaceae bacterium]|nr:signal peptidase I [Polyangiaceae bacterium]
MSKFLRALAWTLIIVGAIVGLLRLTVIRWWRVPLGDPYLEASLAPSVRGGDWLLLWRGTAPLEGDLVLCPEPKAAGRLVVARILAEAKDHVKVSNSVLVNGREFETESGCDPFSVRDPSTGQDAQQTCRHEVAGSRTHLRGEVQAALPAPKEDEIDVPSGHVYLVSDNRQFPWDSREFGPVERSTCAETVVFRVVSKDGFFDVPNRLTLIR